MVVMVNIGDVLELCMVPFKSNNKTLFLLGRSFSLPYPISFLGMVSYLEFFQVGLTVSQYTV